MAEGWTHSRRDRFQLHHGGNCPDGCQCKHTRENRTAPLCRFYLRGHCTFAENCRFLHLDAVNRERVGTTDPRPEKTENSSQSKSHISRTSKSPTRNPIKKDLKLPLRTSGKSCSVEDWVNAPEFVPSGMDWSAGKTQKTYAEAVSSPSKNTAEDENGTPFCSYSNMKECNFGTYSPFTHGLLCDICNHSFLHPNDEEERKKHISECIKKHERAMEISFAIQRSKDKTCGICFEVIMEKASWEQKFGILPNCNHCFCLTCIRKWRQAKNFDSKIVRACPECRVSSDFVCPSPYWVDNKEEKEKLILDYKDALSSKDCKYFLKGRGNCPFGNKCFYLHAYPDGTKADVGPPVRQRRQNADGEIEVFQHIFLWDFLEDRENRWRYNIEDLDDIFAFLSDSDDSDWSDYDFFL